MRAQALSLPSLVRHFPQPLQQHAASMGASTHGCIHLMRSGGYGNCVMLAYDSCCCQYRGIASAVGICGPVLLEISSGLPVFWHAQACAAVCTTAPLRVVVMVGF